MDDKVKKCNRCKVHQPLDNFCNNKSRKDGKQNYCRGCAKNYWDKGSDKYKITHKKYNKDNPEKRKQWAKNHWVKSTDTPEKRLHHNVRRYIQRKLKHNKELSSLEYLGCSIDEYKQYL